MVSVFLESNSVLFITSKRLTSFFLAIMVGQSLFFSKRVKSVLLEIIISESLFGHKAKSGRKLPGTQI